MKAKQIREKTTEEIQADLESTRQELLKLKVIETARNAGHAPLEVRFLKRNIARMQTVLREREIAE